MKCSETCQDWTCGLCEFINHRPGDVSGAYVCEDCGGQFDSVRLLTFPPVKTCEPFNPYLDNDEFSPKPETVALALNTRYRIYVGESTLDGVEAITMRFVPAATFTRATGLWESVTEDVIIVEIIGSSADGSTKIKALAEQLRDTFAQDCVLLTVEDVRGELI